MAPAASPLPADVADLARAALSEGISALRWVVAHRSDSPPAVESVRRAATSLLQFSDRLLRLPPAAARPVAARATDSAAAAAATFNATLAAPARRPPPPELPDLPELSELPEPPAAPSPIAMFLARAGAAAPPPDPALARLSALAELAAIHTAARFPP
ncbi:MAG: hypothetical protein KIT68_04820 [Phycisphaeraceae bacterium]|nr:hypothetical protein [Phycisphaeraceae bacterium]